MSNGSVNQSENPRPSFAEMRKKYEPAIREQRKIERADDPRKASIHALAEAQELSETDALTKLPNRRGFEKRLNDEIIRAGRTETPTTVFILDLNFFKELNDSQGHQAGDEELIRIANLLKSTVRPGFDTVSRLGGDEFAILLPNMDSQQTKKWWERTNFILSQANVNLAIGSATITPEEADKASRVSEENERLQRIAALGRQKLAQADEAMYRAKPKSKELSTKGHKISFLQQYEELSRNASDKE